jgi:hypothetical protein
VGVGGDVFLVVEILGQPDECDGEAQRDVGTHAWGEPLVGHQAGGVVEIGIDEDHLDAQLLKPIATWGALMGAVHAAGRLGIG